MAVPYILFLLICVHYCVGYRLADKSDGPTWPTEYHLKAEMIDLTAGILESRELWSSAAYNRSRMDIYGGLVKKYYCLQDDSAYVTIYSLVPTSTDEYQNKIMCQMSEVKMEDVHLLPELKHYKFAGQEELEGRQVEVWKYAMVYKKYTWIERTLYTYRSNDVDVPVRFEGKNFLNAKGALTAHTVINYFAYESTVDENDLDEGDTDDCEDMQGADLHGDVKHLNPARDSDVASAFHSYKKHHGKNYDTENEHEMRKAIFQENWQMVVHHNRQNHSYRMELNRFADHTPEEMAMATGLLSGPPMAPSHAFPHSDEEVKALAGELPENFDMRLEGFISPVKDQAQCGSCWAFSATAAVEGAVARRNGGRILDLSEQSLVDCAWGSWCYGCGGGVPEYVFHYILDHGIPMEYEYGPYLEQDGLCHRSNMTTTVSIKGFAQPTPLNPQALKVALYKYGPVVVTIKFNKKMEFYSSGIFYDPECNEGHPNHGVTVVGYGVRDGVDYWIVKNSHGAGWGQAGYMLISAADNNCFLLSAPIYPIV